MDTVRINDFYPPSYYEAKDRGAIAQSHSNREESLPFASLLKSDLPKETPASQKPLSLPPLDRRILDQVAAAFKVTLPEEIQEKEHYSSQKQEDAHKSLQRQCFQAAYQACREKKWALIQENAKLLEKLTNSSGQTLLLCAVDDYELEVMEKLLELRISLERTDPKGCNPLHIAAKNGFVEAIPTLAKHFGIDSKTRKNDKTALHEAVEGDQPESVATLIRLGASVEAVATCEERPLTPPALAVYLGLPETFDAFMDTVKKGKGKMIPFTASTATFLHLAIGSGQTSMLRHLLDTYPAQTKELLEKPDSEGRTPLSLAAFLGIEEAIKLLHEKGASVEARDAHGKSAIHYAAKGQQKEALQWLVHLGASFQEKDFDSPRDPLYRFLCTLKTKKGGKISPPKRGSPENLVFQGVGINSIADIGVIHSLEKRGILRNLKRVAGRASGAITATLLATNHTSKEIAKLFNSSCNFLDSAEKTGQQDFSSILSRIGKLSPRRMCKELLKMPPLFLGEALREWMETQITQKTKISYCTFKELRTLIEEGKPFKHIYLSGMRTEPPYEVFHFNSEDPKWDALIIADVVCIALSLPGIFMPHFLYEKRGGERLPRTDLGSLIDPSMLHPAAFTIFDRRRYRESGPMQQGMDRHTFYNPKTWGVSTQLLPIKGARSSFKNGTPVETANQFLQLQFPPKERQQKEERVMVVKAPELAICAFTPSFQEQQKTLVKASTESINAFLGDWDQGTSNIKDPYPHFSGRESILSMLAERCTPSSVTVLFGREGVGKTELALQFAHTHEENFSLIWRVDCTNPFSMGLGYRTLADALQISLKGENSTSAIIAKVHQHLETADFAKPFLLILDNPENPPSISSIKGGAILLITRSKNTEHREIEVPPFTEKEALSLLETVTGEKPSSEMAGLAKDLEYLPFLLHAAAHSIKITRGCTVAAYRKDLAKRSQRKRGTVEAFWEMAFEKLQKEAPLTAGWLVICAYCPASHIPASWIDAWLASRGVKKEQRAGEKEAILQKIIFDFCLLSYTKESHLLSLHPSWQAVMQASRQAFIQADLEEVLAILGGIGRKIHERYPLTLEEREVWKHLVYSLTKQRWDATQAGKKVAEHLVTIGGGLSTLGDHSTAYHYHKTALEMRKEVLGDEHVNVADSLYNVGNSLIALEKPTQAADYHHQALAIYKKSVGSLESRDKDLDALPSYHKASEYQVQAAAMRAKGLEEKALEYEQQALEILKKLLGPRHLGLIEKAHTISDSFYKLGKHAKALKYQKEAFELFKNLPGSALSDKEEIFGSQLSEEEAVKAFKHQRALRPIRNKLLDMTNKLHTVGIRLFDQGSIAISREKAQDMWKEALEYFKEALEMRKILLGAGHLEVAESLHRIGECLVALERSYEAVHGLMGALEVRKKILGPEHGQVANSVTQLGLIFTKMGDHREAEKHSKLAIKIREAARKKAEVGAAIQHLYDVPPIPAKVLQDRRKKLILQRKKG